MSAFYDWDWAGAERRLARAIELNPGNALMRLWNGHHYSIVGRWDEAIAEVQQAQDYDLLSPIVVAIVGWTFYMAKQPERASEELRKVLAIDPGNAIGHFYLGYPYAALKRYTDAIESLNVALRVDWRHAMCARFHRVDTRLAGEEDRSRAIIGQLHGRAKTSYVPLSAFALVHLGLGEDDAMFDWLDRCVEERDALLP